MTRQFKIITGLVFSLGILGFFVFLNPAATKTILKPESDVTKHSVASALSSLSSFSILPSSAKIEIDGVFQEVGLNYSFDESMQASMQRLFEDVRPDFGAFVALDAETGQVLSMVSYAARTRDIPSEHLALKATFPAASVFKVVTAAAAIAEKNFGANSALHYNGANHTLYRSNVLRTKSTRYTRTITLKDAFAKSVNTVFGRLGAHNLGANEIKQYASRFGFNREIASDLPIQMGKALILDDPWNLAETASGYTQDTTMSPLQGALIAAAVVNQGLMMEPYAIQSVTSLKDGKIIYHAEPKLFTQTVSPRTAEEIQKLMRETIIDGTSKRSFRGFFRGPLWDVDVGGKTGSLTGSNPKGKYDWFVGYAKRGNKKLAFASLTINKDHWKIKSSQVARFAIENYFLREHVARR